MTARPERIAYALAPLARFWGDKMVSAVTAGMCRDYAAWRTAQQVAAFKDLGRAKPIAAATARRELVVLAAALNYAFKEGKLKFPVPVALPAKAPARTRWLTRSEAARLLWAAWRGGNRHVARFILVALYTGSRAEAVLRLRWVPSIDAGWVDLEQGLVYRRGAVESESSKRRPPVPISPRLAVHLRRWKIEGDTHIISWGGLPIAKMRRAWHTARRAAGLGPEVVPHVLRHTAAAWAIRAGYSFAKVAAMIGTTENLIEECYGHMSPDWLRDVVASVAGKGR